MKKLLIIANLYHLSSRIPGLAKYITEFGWKAIILTPPLCRYPYSNFGEPDFAKSVSLLEVPYRGDVFWFWRKVFEHFGYKMNESITEQIKERIGETSKRSFIDIGMNWYQTILAYPDTERNWRQPALKKASAILKKERFDAILSSSQVPTCHIVAAELKKQFHLPWLADFRDLWTQNHNYPYGSIRKHFEERLERKTLVHSDALTTVSSGLVERQRDFHKRLITEITNGFDPERLNNSPCDLTEKFTITYTGSIYTGKQDPGKFFDSLKRLISQGLINPCEIEVRFYGSRQNWLNDIIIKDDLGGIVSQCGAVSRCESWQKQKESHILLLLNWEDYREKGIYTSKFFEYLAARRPILASGGFQNDDLSRILMETKAGVYATSVEDIETSILGFYKEYKRTGSVPYNGDLKEINKYSYRGMTRKFVDLLNQMTRETS